MMTAPRAVPQARRHHYVPRFILKGFATERRPKRFQTQVYDKLRDYTFCSPIENVMVENDFNAIEVKGQKVSFERYISKFEDVAAPIIARVVAENSIQSLDDLDRLEVSRFAALQFIRGTAHRIMFEDAGQKTIAEFRRRGFTVANIAPSHDQAKAFALQAIIRDLPEYASHIATKDMLLFQAPPGSEFILGDNPVALKNEEPAGVFGNVGLACRGVQIYLPIHNHLSLAFWCPSIKRRFLSDFEAARSRLGTMKAHAILGINARPLQVNPLAANEAASERLLPFRRTLSDGDVYLSSEENVVHLNSLQVMHAERFVISRSGIFDLPKKMISDSVHFKHGRRMKVG